MKVLYVCADLGVPVLGGKGAAVHVRAMAQALHDAGHAVTLVAGQLVKSPWETPAECAVPVVHVPPSGDIVHASSRLRAFAHAVAAPTTAAGEVRRVLYSQELLIHLRQRFEHHPPDLVYERASLFGVAGLTFAREAGVPHVLELNAPLSDEQQRYRRGGALQALADTSESWLLQHTGAVLAVSAPLAAHVTTLGTDPARVHVIPNGVDTVRFRPAPDDGALRARLGLGPGPVIGFVGGLRPWHGVEMLPRAIAALRRRHPQVHALIVGDGPLRADVTLEVERLGLERHVTLVGAVPHDEIPAFIRAFDVAVAPYPDAPHAFYFSPLKVFEYMACGVPVVAANLGQLSEVVRDGTTGVVYPAGDLDALVRACEAVLADPVAARRMGDAGVAAVAARHTWAHNATRVTRIAEALAARRMAHA